MAEISFTVLAEKAEAIDKLRTLGGFSNNRALFNWLLTIGEQQPKYAASGRIIAAIDVDRQSYVELESEPFTNAREKTTY